MPAIKISLFLLFSLSLIFLFSSCGESDDSEETTKEDIDYTVDKLAEIIARLRSMSPLYEDFEKKNKKFFRHSRRTYQSK